MYPFQLERVTVTDGIYLQIFHNVPYGAGSAKHRREDDDRIGHGRFPFLAALEAANREGRRQAAPLSSSGSNVPARRSDQGRAMS
jgi:hypothetical protein